MEELKQCLKKNKPNISDNSIKTYLSLLKNFFYKHNDKEKEIYCAWFENESKIIELLNDKVPSSRKTTLAAIIAITKNNEKYKDLLMKDGKKYQEYINTQEKSETQKENWIDFNEVKTIYETMYNKIKPLLNVSSKNDLNKKEYKNLQDFIVLSLTCGYWIVPRRSMDYTEMKKTNFSKDDNYIDFEKNKFFFNKYKTAKFYNEQSLDIPKKLAKMLKKFIKLSDDNDYLLTINGKQMSNVDIAKILNNIFKKNISTSMLRHIYLTDKLGNIPALKTLKDLSSDMGHSVNEQLQYIKH